jgi:hypothetical protein
MREKTHPVIQKALQPVRRRVRLSHAVRYGSFGVLFACLGCASLAALSYFIPIPRLPVWMGAAALGLLMLAVIAGVLRPVSYETAARQADAGGLKERVLTALTLFDDSPMALLQREDAVRHLKALKPETAVPLKLNGRPLLMAAALSLLAAGALIFIPNPQNDVLAKREAFAKAMAEQAKAVEEEAEKLEESPGTKEELNELRKLMGDLARDLRKATEPQESYLAMDKAQRELDDLAKQASDKAKAEAAQAFSQSGLNGLSDALSKSDAEAASKAVGQLAKSEAQAQLSSAMQKAANALPEGVLKEAAAQAAQALNAGNLQNLNTALSALNAAVTGTCSGQVPGNAANLGNISSLLAQLRSGTLSASQGSGQAAGSGQGSGTGSGQGTGNSQGQQGGAGAGKGSTNLDGEVTKAGTSSQGEGTNPPGYKLGQYETLYDPTRLNGADDVHQATGTLGEGESQQVQMGPGLGDASGQVPYHEVIFDYQEAASKAAQQEALPEGMQLWVDGYFQALVE